MWTSLEEREKKRKGCPIYVLLSIRFLKKCSIQGKDGKDKRFKISGKLRLYKDTVKDKFIYRTTVKVTPFQKEKNKSFLFRHKYWWKMVC